MNFPAINKTDVCGRYNMELEAALYVLFTFAVFSQQPVKGTQA
jgi:hypothetical protein